MLAKIGKPKIQILARGLTEEQSFDLEKLLIALIGRRDQGKGSLLNLSDGGEGNSGAVRSDEFKRKQSEIGLKRVFTEETRRRMSASQSGRSLSDETRKKVSLGMRKALLYRKFRQIKEALRKEEHENLSHR